MVAVKRSLKVAMSRVVEIYNLGENEIKKLTLMMDMKREKRTQVHQSVNFIIQLGKSGSGMKVTFLEKFLSYLAVLGTQLKVGFQDNLNLLSKTKGISLEIPFLICFFLKVTFVINKF
ncbi:hypothetical protein ACVR0B_03975 [Streptococcus didelphis]